jgi:hypothetical protein
MAPTPLDELNAARKLLSDARLIAFFRAAAKEPHPHAPAIIVKVVEQGIPLDRHFAELGSRGRAHLWPELKVVRESARVFTITFGYHGGLVGDGGVWRVTYTAGGKVQRLEQQGFWIH